MNLNKHLSQIIADSIEAKRKQCYWNAIEAQQGIVPLRDALYVEGFVVWAPQGGAWFEHGWLEYEGQIVDPTLILPPKAKRGKGKTSPVTDERSDIYFPAIRYTYEEVKRLVGTIGDEQMPFASRVDRTTDRWQQVLQEVVAYSWQAARECRECEDTAYFLSAS